jgi:hypothetical protein
MAPQNGSIVGSLIMSSTDAAMKLFPQQHAASLESSSDSLACSSLVDLIELGCSSDFRHLVDSLKASVGHQSNNTENNFRVNSHWGRARESIKAEAQHQKALDTIRMVTSHQHTYFIVMIIAAHTHVHTPK